MQTKKRNYFELQIWIGIFYAGAIASFCLGVFVYLNSLRFDDERVLKALSFAGGCLIVSLVLAFLGAAVRMAIDAANDLKFLRDSAEADLDATEFRALIEPSKRDVR